MTVNGEAGSPPQQTNPSGAPKLDGILSIDALRKLAEQWIGLVGSIFALFVSLLATVTTERSATKTIALILTAVAVGGLILWLIVRRRRASQTVVTAHPGEPRQEGAAIRGLRSFEIGETLPGSQRRRQASDLLARVSGAGFTLCVVSGASGAGKSSLLKTALVDALERHKYTVILISGIPADANTANTRTGGSAAIWNAIDAQLQARNAAETEDVVLILDQFEELLASISDLADRQEFGKALQARLEKRWRVVIGIRKEFYSDLRDVDAQLKRPLVLGKDLIIVRNLDVAEAAEVIVECANRDGIHYDVRLPAIIAGDLSIDGEVRPPDLQVVCDSLRTNMSLDSYVAAGRAMGLRSRFIGEVIGYAGDRNLTRLVLRELCDIPHSRRKTPPVTVQAIVDALATRFTGNLLNVRSVQAILERLEKAYITVSDRNAPEPRWTLTHDYLVDPIRRATEESASGSERALIELDYYRSRQRNDCSTTIPLQVLRRIKRTVPRELLADMATQRLVRRSMLLGIGGPLLFGMVMVLITCIAGVILLTREHWNREVTDIESQNAGDPLAAYQGAAPTQDKNNSGAIVFKPDYSRENAGYRYTIWNNNLHRSFSNYSGGVLVTTAERGTIRSTLYGPQQTFFKADTMRFLWTYSASDRRIRRWSAGENPLWDCPLPSGVTVPRSLVVSPYQSNSADAPILFERPLQSPHLKTLGSQQDEIWAGALDCKAQRWRALKSSDLAPRAHDQSELISVYRRDQPEQRFFTARTRGWIETTSEFKGESIASRLTVWKSDLSEKLLDRTFESEIMLIGAVDAEGGTRVTLLDRQNKRLLTLSAPNTDADGGTGTSATELSPDFMQSFEESPTSTTMPLVQPAAHHLIRQDSDVKTIIWAVDAANGALSTPRISWFKAPEKSAVLIWSESSQQVFFWPSSATRPETISGLELTSSAEPELDSQQDHMLIKDTGGKIQVWKILPLPEKSKRLLKADVSNATQVQFSPDHRTLVARLRGGGLRVWKLADGEELNLDGTVGGSKILWSAYDPGCKRFSVLTDEGNAVAWAQGREYPLAGFFPSEDCAGLPKSSIRAEQEGRSLAQIDVKHSDLLAARSNARVK